MVAKKASDHCDMDMFAPAMQFSTCFKAFSFTVLSMEKSCSSN